jgi:hypothetical protein
LMLFLFTAITMILETFQREEPRVSYYFKIAAICSVILGIIFYIQAQVPYYLEMNG